MFQILAIYKGLAENWLTHMQLLPFELLMEQVKEV